MNILMRGWENGNGKMERVISFTVIDGAEATFVIRGPNQVNNMMGAFISPQEIKELYLALTKHFGDHVPLSIATPAQKIEIGIKMIDEALEEHNG